MISKILAQNIKDLFLQKKYQELINKAEKFTDISERPAPLSNLVGLSKVLKPNKTKEDFFSSLADFEDCYLKAKTHLYGLEGLCNLISVCVLNSNKYQGLLNHLRKAEKMYLEAEKIFNNNERFLVIGTDLYKYLLDHKKMLKILKKLISQESKSKIIRCKYAFTNNYIYDWDQNDYFRYSKTLKNYFPKYKTLSIPKIDYKKNNKIKVGFVATDFKSGHSITYFIKNTFKYLDKEKFQTYGFSLSKNNDEVKNSIKKEFDNWYDIGDLKNKDVINVIQKEKIQILIDLMGLTSAERIGIFNSRICPIQLSWLAYCNTIGFESIDYLVADKNLIYKNEEKFYSEKIIRLPEIWNCHSGFKFERKFNSTPLKKNGFITFGCFGNFMKVSEETLEIWSKILSKINNSKLILKSSNNLDKEEIKKKFKKYNVDESVIILDRLDYPDLEEHLKLYNKVDISLDTFPYNGVTTSFESLWMNVPVLTIKGFNFNSRCGESIMKNAGMDFFISSDQHDYINKAIFLSENLVKLEEERYKIYKGILKTPLFNSKNFALNFSNLLIEVYKTYKNS